MTSGGTRQGGFLDARGMQRMRGPLSLSINEEVGRLVDGSLIRAGDLRDGVERALLEAVGVLREGPAQAASAPWAQRR